MQPFSLSPNYCLANGLPDRCSTGLAIPGVVSHESGDYRTTTLPSNQLGALSPGAPGMPISPKLASGLHRPVTPELLSLRIHSQSHVYKICPGFHRTAVIFVRAFTVPLFYS